MTKSKLQHPSHWYTRTTESVIVNWNDYNPVDGGVFVSPSTIVISVYKVSGDSYGGVMKSTDYGETWTYYSVGDQFGSSSYLRALTLIDATTIVAVTGNKCVVSYDLGETWTTRCWVVTARSSLGNPAMIRTSDGSLILSFTGYDCHIIGGSFRVCSNHGAIARSTDNGVIWYDIEVESEKLWTSAWAPPEFTNVVEAGDGTLYVASGYWLASYEHWAGGYPIATLAYWSNDDGIQWSHLPTTAGDAWSGHSNGGERIGVTSSGKAIVSGKKSGGAWAMDELYYDGVNYTWRGYGSGGHNITNMMWEGGVMYIQLEFDYNIYASYDDGVTFSAVAIGPGATKFGNPVFHGRPGDLIFCGINYANSIKVLILKTML